MNLMSETTVFVESILDILRQKRGKPIKLRFSSVKVPVFTKVLPKKNLSLILTNLDQTHQDLLKMTKDFCKNLCHLDFSVKQYIQGL